MKQFVFAVSSENMPSSKVYEVSDTVTVEDIVQSIITEGYNISDIRMIKDSDCMSIVITPVYSAIQTPPSFSDKD